ncbi:MAG: complex I NDUFA9 subunit family protein [Thermaurantiacus sp.]
MQRLVTLVGGSGFLGTALVEQLARTGARIRVMVRRPAAAHHLKPLGDLGQIEIVAGDIRSESELVRAMEGAFQAVNLVGILAPSGGASFEAIHAFGAQLAADVARRAGAAGFLQVSAIGADPASPSAYGRSKGEGEALVRKAFPAATVVRPSLIFGSEDGFTNRFAQLIATPVPVIPVVAPETRFQPVWVRDVAHGIVEALDRPGETFDFGGPEVMTMREIFAFIGREIGREKRLVDVPDAGARLLASFGFLPGAPLTMDQYRMLQRDNIVSEDHPGLDTLGIQPIPIGAVAPEWLVRYRKGGRFAPNTAA